MSLRELRSRLFGDRTSEITGIYYLIKDLKCLADVIGRDYEVFDKKGKLVYKIRQKPMNISQLNLLMKELKEHNRREEREYRKATRKR